MYGRIVRQRLRALMVEEGWGFRALALAVGWAGSTLNRKLQWSAERGEYESAITPEDVERILGAMGLPATAIEVPQLAGDDRILLERLIAEGRPMTLAALAPLYRERRRDYAPGEGPRLRAAAYRLLEDGICRSVPGGIEPVPEALPWLGLASPARAAAA